MLNNKRINMAISLLVAVTLWCYVVYQVNPTAEETIRNIPVSFENENLLNERGYAIADLESATVDLTVAGSRKELSGISSKDFSATADVSECIEGDNIIEVNVKTLRDVGRTSKATLTIHVTVEKMITAEKQVKAYYGGTLDDGLLLIIDSDRKVKVQGASTLVDSVSYLKAEIPDEKVLKEGNIIEVSLTPVNGQGRTVTNVKLLSDTAKVKVIKEETKEVPLNISTNGKAAEGYTLTDIGAPETVTICGSRDDLNKVSQISAKNIDITGMKEDTEVDIELIIPEGISIPSDILPLKAKISIDALNKKSISISRSEIKLLNVPEGLDAMVETDTVSITVSGADSLSNDDFTLTADLAGLHSGEHKVDLIVKYTGKGKMISVPDSITVKLKGE